jgi:hypothetical protein
MRTDEDIKRDVEYELRWHPDIDPSDLGAAVKDGAVSLSGFARSFRQRRKVEEYARGVPGVKGIANDAEVWAPLINKRPDPEIVREIICPTSHDQLGDTGRKTRFRLEALATPYYVFEDACVEMTLGALV